jgi:hypothetical protein
MTPCKACGAALLHIRGLHGHTLALDGQYVRRFVLRESQLDGELMAQEVDTFSVHVCPAVNGARGGKRR